MICAQRRWYLCKGLTQKISCVDEEYSPDFLTIKLAIARTWRDLIFSYSRLIWWIIFPYSFGEYVERRKHWLSNPSRGIYSLRGVVVINFIPWDKFGAVHGTLAIGAVHGTLAIDKVQVQTDDWVFVKIRFSNHPGNKFQRSKIQ